MAVIAETLETSKWLIAQLKANPRIQAAGLHTKIWRDLAPEDVKGNFITFSVLATSDYALVGPSGSGSSILWTNVLYLVRVTTPSADKGSLGPVVVGIQEALHKQQGVTDLARIVSSVRERPHDPPVEYDKGRYFSHMGGEYRIRCRPL